jgi:large subunit ribosomal protein L15
LYQRLPKRGFKNRFRKVWSIVNLDTLNRFESGTVVTPALLLESGIIKSLKDGIKILGKGNLEKELIVHAHSFSTQAKEKIEIAGGRTEVI